MDRRTGSPAEEYVAATQRAFARCPRYRGLRLQAVAVHNNSLHVEFEGPIEDFRGPYGVRVQLPLNAQDELWHHFTTSDEIEEWATEAVALRAVAAHSESLDQDRGYTADGTWWLIDEAPTE